MIIVTSNDIPGHRIDAVFGEVMGLTVRARDLGGTLGAGFTALGGGEVTTMTHLLYESRHEAMSRMVAEAMQKNANAIVGMRFDSGEIAGRWTEMTAYGTAVYAIPLAAGEPGSTTQSAYLATQPGAPRAGGVSGR